MKVILLRDVAKIGKRFSIVEVPDGFALNKLIPAKDAEPANAANVKRVLEKQKQNKNSATAEVEQIRVIHERFTESPLVIAMDANEQGHLFQSVHISDIVAAATAAGVTIPEAVIKIASPIKAIGLHEVRLEVNGAGYPLSVSVLAKTK